MIDLCRLTADVGPCDDFQTAFYYNATLDRCERFTWGGCAGNANRFSVPADCERRCRQRSLIRRPPTAQHDGKPVKTQLYACPTFRGFFKKSGRVHQIRILLPNHDFHRENAIHVTQPTTSKHWDTRSSAIAERPCDASWILNILLSHSRSLKVIRNDTLE